MMILVVFSGAILLLSMAIISCILVAPLGGVSSKKLAKDFEKRF